MADQIPRTNIRRTGTTAEKRRSGKKDRNYANKMERAAWDKKGGIFPFHTCNGKKNKYYEKGSKVPGRNV